MNELVKSISGYISHYSLRDSKTKEGITISYFESIESIKNWREHPEHKKTQGLGRTTFYSWYEIDIVKVERNYDWTLANSE